MREYLVPLLATALLMSCSEPSKSESPPSVPTAAVTSLASLVPSPTATQTYAAASESTSTPKSEPVPLPPTTTLVPTPTSTATHTPTATATPASTPMVMPTSEPTATVPTPTPTTIPTPAPSPAVPTPTPTNAPTIPSIVTAVSPGVIQIVTHSGTGSGFIIDENGLAVTNAHVVQGYDTVEIRLSGGEACPAEVLGVDESADLALLGLRACRDFDPVHLGDSEAVAVGEDVIAMGYPLGNVDILLGSPTITRGIVSAKRVSSTGVMLLQTDAAINSGSSGGPLFDREGRVVGVSTSKVFETSAGRPVEGIGLAVAINEVRDRLDVLARGGDDSEPSRSEGSEEDAESTSPGTSSDGSPFVAVSVGLAHGCGIKMDGTVVCWGSTEAWSGHSQGRATPPQGTFVSVSAGQWHSCGVRTNGTVACWGSNLGYRDEFIGQSTPPDGSFVSVSAGGFHTCGVRANGTVACWGSNRSGSFFAGQSMPPDGSFVSVSTGGSHTCGVRTNGTVACCQRRSLPHLRDKD